MCTTILPECSLWEGVTSHGAGVKDSKYMWMLKVKPGSSRRAISALNS